MTKDDFIYNILDLDSDKVTIKDINPWEHGYLVEVKWKKNWTCCPACKKYTIKKQDLRISPSKPYKHLVVWTDLCVDLILDRRYFRCKNCKLSFMEKFDFEAEKWYHTTTFARYVIDCWWYMSWNQIARNVHTSDWKPRKILQSIDEDAINIQWLKIMWELEEIWLWIDEHSFKWRDMILVLTDIKAKKVLWILNDTRKTTLQNRFEELPDDIKKKMKWITSDMAQWYQNAILEKKPDLLTSIDKYHLVQEANRMVDSVRMIEIWLAKSKFFNKEDSLRRWKISKKQAEKLLLEEKK